jgi:molybdate transport system regulatory protein
MTMGARKRLGAQAAAAAAAPLETPVLRVHLWLETGEGMLLGLGRIQLLELVEQLGSLNQAAKALGMSYRAAWGRIKRTEDALGEPLLAQASGRKGYQLTPLAERLLRDFAAWHREVEDFALARARERLPWQVRRYGEGGPGQKP